MYRMWYLRRKVSKENHLIGHIAEVLEFEDSETSVFFGSTILLRQLLKGDGAPDAGSSVKLVIVRDKDGFRVRQAFNERHAVL